jgi:outer membrane biosynthesis protein TonB
VAWLLDVVPPDYRLHGVLQRHPIALATLARRHLAACVEGARQGYRTARTELGGVLPVSGVDAVLAAYRSEGHRLVTAARAADLVERALRGKEFTPQRHEAPGPPGQQGQRERQGQQAQPEQQARPGQQAQSEQQEWPERPEQPTQGKQKARQPTPVKQQSVKQQQQPVKQQQKQATAAAVPAKQRRKQAVS